MIKIKKLKIIKSIPKIPKFKWDDQSKIISPRNNYFKILYIFIVTVSFLVVNKLVLQPIINEGKSIEADLLTKKSFIDTNKDLKENLSLKIDNSNMDLEELKKLFYLSGEQNKFYKSFSEIALDNKLKISSVDKLSEDFYSETSSDGSEAQSFENFTQIRYSINMVGNFLNYVNFISELKKINKSLSINFVQIFKDGNGIVSIQSEIIVNFINS